MSNEKTLLFVDDDQPILKSLKRLFWSQPCQVLLAENGIEALKLIDNHSVDVVVSDQRMPHMTGAEFLAEVRVRSPMTIRIIMSGYADISAVIEGVNKAHIHHFLTKPWDSDELKTTVMKYIADTPYSEYKPNDIEQFQNLQLIIKEQRERIKQLENN